jgi:hypothetical protein
MVKLLGLTMSEHLVSLLKTFLVQIGIPVYTFAKCQLMSETLFLTENNLLFIIYQKPRNTFFPLKFLYASFLINSSVAHVPLHLLYPPHHRILISSLMAHPLIYYGV